MSLKTTREVIAALLDSDVQKHDILDVLVPGAKIYLKVERVFITPDGHLVLEVK